MNVFSKVFLLILSVTTFVSCARNEKTCKDTSINKDFLADPINYVESFTYELTDSVLTPNSSWVRGVRYFSCDGKTGYFILKGKKKYFVHSQVPIDTWLDFKNAPSFGKYYNRYLRFRYDTVEVNLPETDQKD